MHSALQYEQYTLKQLLHNKMLKQFKGVELKVFMSNSGSLISFKLYGGYTQVDIGAI